MKKHIIISGVPRAGKSTVSRMISKAYGYQHISMDSIIAGIEKTFPETGIDSDAKDIGCLENVLRISSKIAPFIRAMTDSGEYDELDYGMVIDVFQLLPSDYIKYIDREMCDIYYFITSDVSPEERFALLKKYDTPKDYTYYKSDQENMDGCKDIVEVSRFYREQCIEHKLPYFETAKNRNIIFEEFVEHFK
ncbi:MAG: hypothetical protein K2J72_04820 [Oscillospiraceae bacterium]|nr:hypothetical protein [Oscillospiraceae bacterium]